MANEKEQKFIIMGGGDMSVGIFPSHCEVTFKSNHVWDKDLIDWTKGILNEWDDNGAHVYTEQEYDELISVENEMIKESELEEQKLQENDKDVSRHD